MARIGLALVDVLLALRSAVSPRTTFVGVDEVHAVLAGAALRLAEAVVNVLGAGGAGVALGTLAPEVLLRRPLLPQGDAGSVLTGRPKAGIIAQLTVVPHEPWRED